MLCNILFIVIAAYIARRFLFGDGSDKPMYGVYQLKGRWYYLKFITMLIMVQCRRWRKSGSNAAAGYGIKSRASAENMDCAQPLPDNCPDAVDAVYFNGGNAQGDYIVFAVARRQKGLAQSISLLRLDGLGRLEHPRLPDTNLSELIEENISQSGFCTQQLKIIPLKTNYSWKLDYKGSMRLIPSDGSDSMEVEVVMNLTWTARHKVFDFDTDQDIWVLCDAIAQEPWSRCKFKELERAHQTHYEQFGVITGWISIEGRNDRELTVSGVRDHSYGNIRRWEDLYRYGLHYITSSDGTCIALGCVSMPRCLSSLPIGFVCTKEGEVIAIRDTDFKLSCLGQDGHAPTNYTFGCLAGGRWYYVRVNIVDSTHFFMGTHQESRIFERFAAYEVDGIKGWGVSEWLYRNDGTWSWPNPTQ